MPHVVQIVIAVAVFLTLPVVVIAGLYVWSWAAAPRHSKKVFETVGTNFGFLEALGLQCIRRSYDWKTFGNAVMEYEGGELRARFALERSQWSLHLGKRGPGQADHEVRDLLLQVVSEAEKQALREQLTDVEAIGKAAARHVEAIVALL